MSGQFFVHDSLSDNLTHDHLEAFTVITETLIESKDLFIQVAEHMKRFNTNVGALNATLQERPEVLNAVGVNVSTHIFFGVTHEGMLESLIAKKAISSMFVRVDTGATLHGLANDLQGFVLP